MVIDAENEFIRYTGRWYKHDKRAVSSANGNYFEFSYRGETCVLGFEVKNLEMPFPHIYISVDNGAKIEVSLLRFIRISADCGEHTVRVILKSSVETQNRWLGDVCAKVELIDIEADDFIKLSDDERPVIEFIGDSIIEGIAIDCGYESFGENKDMVFWDDSTAGYTWLCANELDMRPVTMGYGCLGVTNNGAGNIPPVEKSYSFYRDGVPMKNTNADFIVINHGTNDTRSDKDKFKKAYYSFLKYVRSENKKAKIISLTPFSGCLAKEIKEAVIKYNKELKDNVFYIDTTGWIDPEPIHPTRKGHKTVAKNLSEIIRKEFLLK